MKKNVVLKLDIHDQKAKQKALKLVCGIPGIESFALDMDNKLTVTGDVDPATLVVKLRRTFRAEIISVGPAKELEKDKHKKEESKKADEKKKMDSGQVMQSQLDYPNIPLWKIPCSTSTSSLDIDTNEELEVTSFSSAEPLPQGEFEISIHNSETQVFQSVSVLPLDNIGIPSNQIPQHGMSPILETKTEIIASETERKLQMKPELSVGPTMSITLIKSRWAQFSNMQLVTFHPVHSTKMCDAIKDLGFGNFLLGENNYMVFVRINEKIEKSLEPESDRAKFSGGGSLSSGLLGRRGTFISLPKDFILWEAGVGLTEPPLKEKWGRPFVIALMNNEFSSLSTKPNCPNLGFLFLQNNRCLRTISDSFFDDMPSLGVLDLSNTKIRSLPSSLFKLTELQALFLRDCNNLDGLPPEVGNLEHIEVLDLWSTEVYSLPDEIAKLKYLKCLRVSFYGADDDSEYHNLPPDLISSGVISSLLALQALTIIVHPADWRWKNNAKAITIDVSSLGKLTYLQFYFPEVELFHLFIHESLSWKAGCLRNFKFVVGNDINRIVSRVPDDIEYYYNEYDRCLRFVNDDRIPKDVGVLKRITAFYLDNHCAIKNLLEFGVASLKELKFCVVRECTNIVAIIEGEEITESVLPCLVHLSLHYLWRLETIWKGPVPHGSLQGLKYLSLHTCPRLEFVLSWSMLHCLSNMEELMVEDCASVKVIIEMEGQTVDHGAIFPCLKKVTLSYLPQLQFLSNGVCPLSAHVSVYACPKWKEKQEGMPCQEVGG